MNVGLKIINMSAVMAIIIFGGCASGKKTVSESVLLAAAPSQYTLAPEEEPGFLCVRANKQYRVALNYSSEGHYELDMYCGIVIGNGDNSTFCNSAQFIINAAGIERLNGEIVKVFILPSRTGYLKMDKGKLTMIVSACEYQIYQTPEFASTPGTPCLGEMNISISSSLSYRGTLGGWFFLFEIPQKSQKK